MYELYPIAKSDLRHSYVIRSGSEAEQTDDNSPNNPIWNGRNLGTHRTPCIQSSESTDAVSDHGTRLRLCGKSESDRGSESAIATRDLACCVASRRGRGLGAPRGRDADIRETIMRQPAIPRSQLSVSAPCTAGRRPKRRLRAPIGLGAAPMHAFTPIDQGLIKALAVANAQRWSSSADPDASDGCLCQCQWPSARRQAQSQRTRRADHRRWTTLGNMCLRRLVRRGSHHRQCDIYIL